MKFSVDVDCTPVEARLFLGLPDLTPVHDAYVDRMTKLVTDGASSEMLGDMLNSWGPMSETGLTVWRQMFEQMSGKR